ncbi:MAG TPA: NADH-quinone oxidoreductase subunit N [Nitrospirota bacterium]|nr:NADH-quinone oxidoreductase subunit N [Nitrospirota bacterium]
MSIADLAALSPYIVLGASAAAVMLVIALRRNHALTALLTLTGFVLAAFCVALLYRRPPHAVTPLLIIDDYAYFYAGLVILAGSAVAAMSYSYLEKHAAHREEFYVLLLAATLGCAVLPAAAHFASFFLGIEILSVSLYALAGYFRHNNLSVEAGLKYLILAAVSSAFVLFGMALVFAATGTLAFAGMQAPAAAGPGSLPFLAGVVMIITGVGFKLAVVPFHLWTPDVYEGAPAPVTAFIATASKGAVFALLLRYFSFLGLRDRSELAAIVALIAVLSMFAGNILALLQQNVKRLLAYSSIAHLGYLLITALASGPRALSAAALYLAAYFITTLGAFGVVAALSDGSGDAAGLDAYRGLSRRRPLLAAVFASMLFSLAGIPLTAGFVGKFFLIAAGAGSSLWFAVIALVVNSVIGLFYYLRIIVIMFTAGRTETDAPAASRSASAVLVVLMLLLIWVGVYPGPLLDVIASAVDGIPQPLR